MNTQLIPTQTQTIGGMETMTVNARELHQFLDVQTRFDKWILRRIEEYGFTQAIDFIECPKLANRGWFGSETNEYFITIDMAKELAMVERTEKGRMARRYFIECERRVFDTHQTIEQMREALLKARPDWANLVRYHDLGLNAEEKSTLLGCSKDALRHRERALEQLGLIVRKINTRLSNAGKRGSMARQQKAQFNKQQLPMFGGQA